MEDPKNLKGLSEMFGTRIARRRRIAAALLLCLGAMFVSFASAAPASATTGTEEKMARLINQARNHYGRASLRLSQSLSDKARSHSRKMRDAGRIFHSTKLAYTLRNYSWDVAGENVGRGPSIESLHRAFMNSPSHRDNVLYRKFRRMGVGAVWKDGTCYITIIFMDY